MSKVELVIDKPTFRPIILNVTIDSQEELHELKRIKEEGIGTLDDGNYDDLECMKDLLEQLAGTVI
jgi:hypothetical protein